MEPRPDHDLGPDPRLNGRGVALTGAQRRVLAGIAVVIGGLLALAVAGLTLGFPAGAPEQPAAAAGTPPFGVVVGGAGRAQVVLRQQGGGETALQVALPWTAPVDPAADAVSVEARLLGRDRGEGITCIVRDGSGAVVQQMRDAGGGATVRCAASAP